MPHAANHGHGRLDDGTGQRFVVEGPQILHGSAAANQQQHIDLILFPSPAGLAQRIAQLACRLCALHTGRIDDHRNMRYPALKGRHHIMQSRRSQ